jgi:hypothetical protein
MIIAAMGASGGMEEKREMENDRSFAIAGRI